MPSWPVAPPDMYGCILWQGQLDRDGYGLAGAGKRAHRAVWEREHGPIPAGMEADHGCRRRSCCQLAHLTLVDRSENERRKSWARRVKQKRCAAGHDLFLDGAVTPEGGKVCLRCSGLR